MRSSSDDAEAIWHSVARGLLTPGTLADPVVVRVGDSALQSVWATEDYDDVMSTRGRAGRRERQGGFPQQRPGRIYAVVVDLGVIAPKPIGCCRWCAGDGFNPFLPQRMRQVLAHGVYLDTPVFGRELRLAAMRYRHLGYESLRLFASLGLESEDVACPRCGGHGSLDVEPVAVLHSGGQAVAQRDRSS